jgi:hypothetical protein
MQDRRTRKLVGFVTAALAAALLAVPVAQARVIEGTGQSASVEKRQVVRTDARHAALLNKAHVVGVIVQPSEESNIARMHRHLAGLDFPAGVSTSGTVSTGFDWTDAAIGAGAVFGLVLLAGGGALVTRRKLVSA